MAEEKSIPLHRERLGLPDREDQQKLTENKRKLLTHDMAVCFGTAEGRRVLRYLMTLTGYKKVKVGGNPALGMDVLQGSFYNTTREQVCIEMLEFVPAGIIKAVEYGTHEDLEN